MTIPFETVRSRWEADPAYRKARDEGVSPIAWNPVDRTAPRAVRPVRARSASCHPTRRARAGAFSPVPPEGQTTAEVVAAIAALTAWSPEGNRLAAANPLNDGSQIAYFYDRASACRHLDRIAVAAMPEDSIDDIVAAAGFATAHDGRGRFAKTVGSSLMELAIRQDRVSVELVKSPARRRSLCDLYLPVDQGHPIRSVGVWPNGRGELAALVAVALDVAADAVDLGMLGPIRRRGNAARARSRRKRNGPGTQAAFRVVARTNPRGNQDGNESEQLIATGDKTQDDRRRTPWQESGMASHGDCRTWRARLVAETGDRQVITAEIEDRLVIVTVGTRQYECDRPEAISLGDVRGIMLAAVEADARRC